jgi:hypothetical protein
MRRQSNRPIASERRRGDRKNLAARANSASQTGSGEVDGSGSRQGAPESPIAYSDGVDARVRVGEPVLVRLVTAKEPILARAVLECRTYGVSQKHQSD